MPTFEVNVKWGRQSFTAIEVNTDEEPLLFKAQLFALTGVQPERQKVMWRGSQLKDCEWNIQLKNGATLLLLGSKEEVPQTPETPTLFVEDMNETELATAMKLPAGLTNLGNTCYMNATVQCLKSVKELREALNQCQVDITDHLSDQSLAITASMKHVFQQMDKGNTVTPILLLQTLHRAFPQFSQTGENGTYRQQDANECWSELLKMLQAKLPPLTQESEQSPKYKSVIQQYFGGTFEVQMSCDEAPEEQTTCSTEDFLQLSCFISQEVKYMQSGLKSKMKEQLTKYSNSLGRDAIYKRSCLISRLPAYLTVQFVRFQYKGKEGINAKVLKDIKFPIDFDAFEMCTPALQKKMEPLRSELKKLEDLKVEQKSNADHKCKGNEIEEEMYEDKEDRGSNNSGYYTLQAVLTHKGRSSSSGHYVSWVRYSIDNWMKFDDDVVTPATSEDILRLSGGGDWHCAYVLLYGPKSLAQFNCDLCAKKLE